MTSLLDLLIVYIWLRHLPALSSAAEGGTSELGLAWLRTQSVGLRLLGALIVFSLPWLVCSSLPTRLFTNQAVHQHSVLSTVLATVGQATLALPELLLPIALAKAFLAVPIADAPDAARPRRRQWPIVMQIQLIVLSGMVAIPTLVWLGLFLWNCFDEPLLPATRLALQHPQRPSGAPKANGYVWLVALDSRRADPVNAAQQWLDAQFRLVAKAPLESETVLDAERTRLLNPISVETLKKISCRPWFACLMDYDQMRQQRMAEEVANSDRDGLLRHYEAMLNAPDYVEDLAPSILDILPNRMNLIAAQFVYNQRLIYQLDDGDLSGALNNWARQQRFLLRAGEHTESMPNWLGWTDAVAIGQSVLIEMMVRHPEIRDQARNVALPLLTDDDARRVAGRLGHTAVNELWMGEPVFRGGALGKVWHHVFFEPPLDSNDGYAQLLRPPVQVNASLNLEHRAILNALSKNHVPLEGIIPPPDVEISKLCPLDALKSPSLFDNPGGKVLVCSYDLSHNLEHWQKGADQFLIMTGRIRAALEGDTTPDQWRALQADVIKAIPDHKEKAKMAPTSATRPKQSN